MTHQCPRPNARKRPPRLGAFLLLLFAVLLIPLRLSASEAAPDIEATLSEMAREGQVFNPDDLLKMGPRGFSALLDRLLPETAEAGEPLLSREDALRLIEQLGNDDFESRELATQRLAEVGQPFEELIVDAAQDEDPEVRFRARSVLSAWQKAREEYQTQTVSQYEKAFGVYVKSLADDECLRGLARRVRLALEKGSLHGEKQKLLAHCVEAIAKSGKDEYCDVLTPLLDHKDLAVATWVTRCVGSYSRNRFFPSLLIQALQSGREEVVETAIDWTSDCWDQSRSQEVKRLLTKIFEGESENLKFHACFPLMYSYGDKKAVAYILLQTQSKDKARARTAIYWIGDACNGGKKAYPELLEALVPFLQSDDKSLRRAAADALGTYAGEEVVRNLIPLLADPEPIIVGEASRNLLKQKDKVMLRRYLTDAQANHSNSLIRQRAGELLEKLEAEK